MNDTVNIHNVMISIIIPVYNCANYLKAMLDSIYAQTYTDFEVIAAYDTKSKDNSLNILIEYSKKYGLVIDSAEDTSPGKARNRGFQLAKGEYIIFFDGDDLVVPTYLGDLMSVYIKHPDLNVVCGNFLSADENNVDKKYNLCLSSKASSDVYDLEEALERWLPAKKYVRDGRLFTAPWTWLVRKKYLEEYNIDFPDYSHSEDHLYTGKLIINSEKIGYTKKKGYLWIMHSASTSHRYRPYDECYDRERRFMNDMTLLLADKYPNILARLKAIRDVEFNKEYIMRLWELSYAEFILKLQEKNLMYLEYSEAESFMATVHTFCFNHFKWLLFEYKKIRCAILKLVQ